MIKRGKWKIVRKIEKKQIVNNKGNKIIIKRANKIIKKIIKKAK